MAGSGTDLVNTDNNPTAETIKDAPDSICPRNWKLSVSGANYTTFVPFVRQDSYFELFKQYGYPASPTEYIIKGHNAATLILNGTNQHPNKSPFYFANAGGYYPQVKYANWIGTSGGTWTSTVHGSALTVNTAAYFTNSTIEEGLLSASGTDPRYYGIPVRCLAK